MRMPYRLAFSVALGVATAAGLSACGGDEPADDKATEASDDKPVTEDDSKGAEEEIDNATNIAGFEGSWELQPNEPHGTTSMTIDAEGTVTSEGNATMGEVPSAGTVTTSDGKVFLLEMATEDGNGWSYTLNPVDEDTYTAVDEDGNEFGKLVRTG